MPTEYENNMRTWTTLLFVYIYSDVVKVQVNRLFILGNDLDIY